MTDLPLPLVSALGIATVPNELLAYQELARWAAEGSISGRAAALASYALCGFASFGTLVALMPGAWAGIRL